MILSDKDIAAKLKTKEILISPMPDMAEALGTVSIDLRLGSQFMKYRTTDRPFIDVRDPKTFEGVTETVNKKDDEAFVIHPQEFVLGSTLEKIELPANLAGRLEGKSSLGRLGIVIHSTAGKIDPGFKGNLVLEITNIGNLPVMLYPGMRVCQVLFEQLSSPTTQSYTDRESSKYKNQDQTVASRANQERN